MPAKTYNIEGTDESKEQVFSTPSKALSYRNTGQNPVQMHLVSTSPNYNEETITIDANMEEFETLPVIVDRIKFTFTEKSKIELIEEY